MWLRGVWMKKKLLIILTITMCFIVSACGKSEEAINADNLIMNIGEVTLESADKIKVAEEAIDQLTDQQKKQLENMTVLENAKTKYNDLMTSKVQESISAIGTVNLESEEVIKTARTLYDSCSDEVKNSVNNYAILETAENELSSLKINNVVNLINQIGTITLDSEAKIMSAQSAYNALTSEEKAQVTNSDIINNAPQKLKELKVKNAVSKLNSETDKVEGITWYKSKTQPYYADSRSYILPYIGTKSSSTWLRLIFHYTGDQWIFFDSVTIVVDGKKYQKNFSYGEVNRDNDTEVWEWADISPSNQDIEMLKEIANSSETIVRFQGDVHHYDLVVSQQDKNAIRDVVTAYEALQ